MLDRLLSAIEPYVSWLGPNPYVRAIVIVVAAVVLAKVDGLRVAARTSTFYFKDKDATIADVATALDVDTVHKSPVRLTRMYSAEPLGIVSKKSEVPVVPS